MWSWPLFGSGRNEIDLGGCDGVVGGLFRGFRRRVKRCKTIIYRYVCIGEIKKIDSRRNRKNRLIIMRTVIVSVKRQVYAIIQCTAKYNHKTFNMKTTLPVIYQRRAEDAVVVGVVAAGTAALNPIPTDPIFLYFFFFIKV